MTRKRNSLAFDRSRCFAPVVHPSTRILMLGSLPGRESLARQQYYAHPRNQFWRLIGAVLGEALEEMAYEARLAALAAHHIGLWDCIAEATRPGSLDMAIRDAIPNSLGPLIATLPQLRLVAFNGKKAAALGEEALKAWPGAMAVVLPSSSPANTLPFDRKLEIWRSHISPALKSF